MKRSHVTCVRNGVITRGIVGDDEQLGEEGIDWIRGWHYAESEDAQAMLAAWKLRGSSRAMELHVASEMFKQGKMSRESWLANLDQWDAEFEAGERDR
jgi:hypothetical protein